MRSKSKCGATFSSISWLILLTLPARISLSLRTTVSTSSVVLRTRTSGGTSSAIAQRADEPATVSAISHRPIACLPLCMSILLFEREFLIIFLCWFQQPCHKETGRSLSPERLPTV